MGLPIDIHHLKSIFFHKGGLKKPWITYMNHGKQCGLTVREIGEERWSWMTGGVLNG